jgi:hypothetical protein
LLPRFTARTLVALVVVAVGTASDARADWMFTPFVGSSFGTQTSYTILETGPARHSQLIFGGAAAYLSRGIFGVEADLSYAPHFFERADRLGLTGSITGSGVTTLNGSVIVAVPLAVTRESLRPYAVAGMGLIHASANDSLHVFDIHDNILGANLGAGAIGLISPRTGFRFEIRHFRSVQNAPKLTGENSARLSFWRATVGVVIRLAN